MGRNLRHAQDREGILSLPHPYYPPFSYNPNALSPPFCLSLSTRSSLFRSLKIDEVVRGNAVETDEKLRYNNAMKAGVYHKIER